MPVDLHERLSEFSYGYGVTRDVEKLLRKQRLSAIPFLPSLIHEKKVGFDVGFKRKGTPLLFQFKLGQAMRRFIPGPRPPLGQQFWRFRIDTAEPDGQYEILLKSQMDGAEVYYIAPKFHDWENYLNAFEHNAVLSRSLLVTPKQIRDTLDHFGVPDGIHKVVYGSNNTYLCSDPLDLNSTDPSDIAGKLEARIQKEGKLIEDNLFQIFEGLSHRSDIRRRAPDQEQEDGERLSYEIPSDAGRQPLLREQRFERLLQNGFTLEQAVAITVGAEAWSSGAQLIYVTVP